jgi:hypothetical protein
VPSGNRTVFLEEETPTGRVPPAPKSALAPSSPQPKANSTQSKPQVAESPLEAAQGTIQQFSKAYVDKGSPRIAVFLNRTLSDDVREWRSDARIAAAYEQRGVTQMAERTHDQETSVTQSNVTAAGEVSIEQPTESGERQLPVCEPWVWAFEDGFLKPLLEAKAKTVDRATILRLTAATNPSGAMQPVAPKQIEMAALTNYADIFVEVLVARSPSALYGYEFRASAKEVKTGIILANVTSAQWSYRDHKGQVVVATSEGYKTTNALTLPGVQDVASDLSLDLMRALARTWTQ